jgi:hypothetical protein
LTNRLDAAAQELARRRRAARAEQLKQAAKGIDDDKRQALRERRILRTDCPGTVAAGDFVQEFTIDNGDCFYDALKKLDRPFGNPGAPASSPAFATEVSLRQYAANLFTRQYDVMDPHYEDYMAQFLNILSSWQLWVQHDPAVNPNDTERENNDLKEVFSPSPDPVEEQNRENVRRALTNALVVQGSGGIPDPRPSMQAWGTMIRKNRHWTDAPEINLLAAVANLNVCVYVWVNINAPNRGIRFFARLGSPTGSLRWILNETSESIPGFAHFKGLRLLTPRAGPSGVAPTGSRASVIIWPRLLFTNTALLIGDEQRDFFAAYSVAERAQGWRSTGDAEDVRDYVRMLAGHDDDVVRATAHAFNRCVAVYEPVQQGGSSALFRLAERHFKSDRTPHAAVLRCPPASAGEAPTWHAMRVVAA